MEFKSCTPSKPIVLVLNKLFNELIELIKSPSIDK